MLTLIPEKQGSSATTCGTCCCGQGLEAVEINTRGERPSHLVASVIIFLLALLETKMQSCKCKCR